MKFFPSGGWGWLWAGDPDRGYAEEQPGNWIYNILPYLEQTALREKGAGLPDAQKIVAISEVISTPLATFACPSRRAAITLPTKFPNDVQNAVRPTPFVAKTDYAANCGDYSRNSIDTWVLWTPGTPMPARPRTPQEETGISFRCSKITTADVLDGTAFTLAAAEKYLAVNHWMTGMDDADNENMYVGYNNDSFRCTHTAQTIFFPPRRDRVDSIPHASFGSAHDSAFHAVFCDGSVRPVNYSLASGVYSALGNRKDGRPIPAGSY